MTKLRAINDTILAYNGDFKDHVTNSGIVIKSTAGKNEGITPRWFQVLEVGPESEYLVNKEQWIYVEYGRWSEALELEDDRLPDGKGEVWRIDPAGCMLVSDDAPENNYQYNKDTAFDGVYRNPLDN
mgnify:CR=1 FL=1|jgi:hypothetical protein|tara:strand:- start:19622 stop:20002 length:381 start_codon:yes stop_codon:yes gene_type:complete